MVEVDLWLFLVVTLYYRYDVTINAAKLNCRYSATVTLH